MKKTFVLLTEATLSSEKATLNFGSDNDVVVPLAVVERIYQYDKSPEKARIASKFVNYISMFSMKDLLSSKGVKQSNGSSLRIVDCATISREVNALHNVTELYKRAFQVCLDLSKSSKYPVVLISQNPSVRLKAQKLGITSQEFKDEIFPLPRDQYKGRAEVFAAKSAIDKLYTDRALPINAIYQYNKIAWHENMFVTISSEGSSAIARYTDGMLVPLMYQDNAVFKPENAEQKMFMECLMAPPDIAPLVIVKGGAGTGKTYCALAAALHCLTSCGPLSRYEQILVSAPAVTIDEDLGFLPGGIGAKISPYINGVNNNLVEIFKHSGKEFKIEKDDDDDADADTEKEKGKGKIKVREKDKDKVTIMDCRESVSALFRQGLVSIQAIGFLRGSSIVNTFYFIDEVQNIKPEIMKDIITRLARGSKLVLAGDPTQVNTPGLNERRNGLVYASEKFKDISKCWQIELDSKKTVRSELAMIAQEIL